MNTEKRKNFLINVLYFAVILSIIYVCFKFLSIYLMPFLIGMFACFIVQKPANVIAKKTKIPKSVLTIFFVVLTYAIVLIACVGIIYFLYTKILNFASAFVPVYLPILKNAFSGINLKLAEIFKDLPQNILNTLNSLPSNILSAVAKNASTYLTNFGAYVIKSAPNLLITVVVTLVASCFIARDYEKVIKFIKMQLNKKTLDIVTNIKDIFQKNIFKVLRGYIIIMFITFIELSILLLILKKPNFAALAAIITIVDILPVLGTGTVLIPWSLYSLITGDIYGFIVLLLGYIIITVIRQFIEPKIIGQQLGLHPLVMLIALFVGLKIAGFAGMIMLPLSLIVITDLQKNGKISLWKTTETKEKNTNTDNTNINNTKDLK